MRTSEKEMMKPKPRLFNISVDSVPAAAAAANLLLLGGDNKDFFFVEVVGINKRSLTTEREREGIN